MSYKRSLCWIRRDLRLSDQRALFEATRQSQEVALVFVFDSEILKRLAKNDRRLPLLMQSVLTLDQELQNYNSALTLLHGDPREQIPHLAYTLKADAVFLNEDYEPYAKARDLAVAKGLKKLGVQFHSYKDQVLFSPSELLKSDGTPYVKFTPYKNAWLKKVIARDCAPFKPDLRRLLNRSAIPDNKVTLKRMGFENLPPATDLTEAAAHRLFKKFINKIEDYQRNRDFPALEGTSALSLHLRFGTISIRHLVKQVLTQKSAGANAWLSELIWREFYQMILDHFPEVEDHEFLKAYRDMKWTGKKAHFEAWCAGRTGYPLIDAAMRQLNQTGWMHNRLRMITASFLVKDLLIDWRKGERYFAKQLLDYDLAANNGGWQWCASTGCDAQPYFRIFNPIAQSKKFDPEGEFIRRFVPELKSLSNSDIHMPPTPAADYPTPIVDHARQRIAATRLFQVARGRTAQKRGAD